MNRLKNHIMLPLSAALAAVFALALAPGHAIGDEPPDIEIAYADIGGSGCPMDTARAVLSTDKRTLSIIFDQYYGEDNEYLSCNIAVALTIPEGFTVALIDIDYRGYANIPDLPGRKAWFRTEYFFAGSMGPVHVTKFGRGYDSSFMILHDVVGTVWAPCGAEVIARANTSIRTWGEGTFLAIDTADVTTNGVTFYLDWAEC